MQKKPLTEGTMRHMVKGLVTHGDKPGAPPPAPQPSEKPTTHETQQKRADSSAE